MSCAKNSGVLPTGSEGLAVPTSKGKENLIPESDSYKIRPALTKEQGKINQRI